MKDLLLLVVAGAALIAGCKKEKDPGAAAGCTLRGTYVGTSTKSTGQTAQAIYIFQDNNFAVGKETVSGPNTTWGGYRNDCDSVYISVYYQTLNSYYILKAKLLNNMATVSGSYNNLTNTSDFGTFVMNKQ